MQTHTTRMWFILIARWCPQNVCQYICPFTIPLRISGIDQNMIEFAYGHKRWTILYRRIWCSSKKTEFLTNQRKKHWMKNKQINPNKHNPLWSYRRRSHVCVHIDVVVDMITHFSSSHVNDNMWYEYVASTYVAVVYNIWWLPHAPTGCIHNNTPITICMDAHYHTHVCGWPHTHMSTTTTTYVYDHIRICGWPHPHMWITT